MYNPMAAHIGMKREFRSLGIFILFLIGCYVFFVFPHLDDFDIPQKQCGELNRFWKTKAQKDFAFTNGWNLGVFECPSHEAGMARALFFISKLDADISGKSPEQKYYTWASQMKPKIRKRILFGLAGRTTFETHTIDISPAALVRNNWVKIAGVLVHELRHLEQGINTHVPCVYNSDKACDQRLERQLSNGGAYNYNILFFDQIRKMTVTTRYEKKLAKREMQRIFDKHFNKVTLEDRMRYQLEPNA